MESAGTVSVVIERQQSTTVIHEYMKDTLLFLIRISKVQYTIHSNFPNYVSYV